MKTWIDITLICGAVLAYYGFDIPWFLDKRIGWPIRLAWLNWRTGDDNGYRRIIHLKWFKIHYNLNPQPLTLWLRHGKYGAIIVVKRWRIVIL